MKAFASLLSFYFLSLTIAPAMQALQAQFLSCKSACTKPSADDRDKDGCDKKECTVFSCCFKTQLLPPASYKSKIVFMPELAIQHNFKPSQDYISIGAFDIWHPPRFI